MLTKICWRRTPSATRSKAWIHGEFVSAPKATVGILLQFINHPAKQRNLGALAGAIFLDQAFGRILKQTVGKNDWNKLAEEDIQDALEKYWERSIKPRFNNSTSSYQVKLGGKEYSISKYGTTCQPSNSQN